jgi:serine/threonine protein phosphatase PrpC
LNRRLKILNKNILTDNINSIIVDTFLDINSKLHKSQVIDTSFSGSTCSSMILTPEKVLTANVGDSRTILGRLVDGGKSYYKFLSMAKFQHNQGSQTDRKRRIRTNQESGRKNPSVQR